MSGRQVSRGERVAVLAPGSVTGDSGGAERLYAGLCEALTQAGCDVDLIKIPTDEATFAGILDAYEKCSRMDLSRYDLVISTKAPTFMVRHPRHVVYLVHTVRVFYDMFDLAFPAATPALLEQRRYIQSRDTEALRSVKHRFAIGHEVAARLRDWNGLDAEVLHPPLGMNRFRGGRAEGYFFLPGRLHPWKRVDLAIRAVMGSSLPLRLLIAGSGEADSDLRALAAGDPRIEFLGRISDDALIDHYARCLAVPFVPVREDYGYVTLEAFSSGKAVITCTDSGEPVQLVAHGVSGWVCEPTPESVREAMEACFRNPDQASEMGERGRESIRDIAWPSVVQRLLDAGDEAGGADQMPRADEDHELKVAVLDMQPIEPAVGGGRLRLLGLYHALGQKVQARYVGSYDWPGERFRRQQLSSTLEEIVVPLSSDHHAAARRLSEEAGGKVVIDIAFPRLGHLSADYLKATREAVDWADVIVVSHPWVYPLIADRIRQSQLVVYDAHNVEGFLRAQLLDAGRPIERQLLREVVAAEYRAGLRADLVLVCSDEDRAMFERIYEWPGEKIRLAPNGVMAKAIVPASARERAEAKAACGLPADAVVAVFIGSAYGPNVEAARFIIENLAPSLPEIVFVILGGVGDCLGGPRRANLRVTGSVDDETKRRWLRASDLAVNPMFSGSGTNIKMFDFMAAGLPVITTAVGSRGIKHSGGRALLIVNRSTEDFVGAVRGLAADAKERASRGKSARTLVETSYSWERISQCLGELLRRSWRGKEQRERGQRKRMAMLTTWNTKCGIAEHASYLVQALGEAGWEVIVLGNQLPPDGPVNLNQEMLVPCLRVWTWDNVTWCSSDLDLEKTRGALAHLAPDLLCIQHHTGFISGERYAGVIRAAVELDLPVLVELHNARDLVRLDGVGTLSGQRVALIVHDATEQDLLATKTRLPITTLPLPVQIHSTRNAQPSAGPIERVPGTPLIGGFGFLRPYKGVKKAIRIVAALKRLYPEVRYVGYHASYQDGESGEYLRECLAEATRLGVTEAISIDTEFRDIGEIVDGLSRVDAVLLPYDELLEGASASANVAIAAGRPVVTSTAQIFNPLREVVLMVEGESTDAYVEVLDRLFRDGEFCERQARKTMRWAEEHSYDKAARRLIEVASRLM